jgi:hypothetical protein
MGALGGTTVCALASKAAEVFAILGERTALLAQLLFAVRLGATV